MSEVKVDARLAPKLYQALRLAYLEFGIIENYCHENGMKDDEISCCNLRSYLLSVLQEAEIKEDSKQNIKIIKFNNKEK